MRTHEVLVGWEPGRHHGRPCNAQWHCSHAQIVLDSIAACLRRSAEAARLSEIRPEASTPAGIRNLLLAFQGHGPHVLLFLKSVRKIRLLVRSQGQDAPQLLHTITQTTQVRRDQLC